MSELNDMCFEDIGCPLVAINVSGEGLDDRKFAQQRLMGTRVFLEQVSCIFPACPGTPANIHPSYFFSLRQAN